MKTAARIIAIGVLLLDVCQSLVRKMKPRARSGTLCIPLAACCLFAFIPGKGHSQPLSLFGIDLSMTLDEITSKVTQRGLHCDDDLSSEIPEFSEFLVCFDASRVLEDQWVVARAEATGQKLDAYIEQNPDLGSLAVQDTLNLLASDLQFPMILSDSSEVASDALALVNAVFVYEHRGERQAIFTCATFNACDAPRGEVSRQVFAGRGVDVREAVAYRPGLIRSLRRPMLELRDAISGTELEPWGNFFSDLLLQEVLDFELSLVPCGYGAEGDRLCVYDGALELVPLNSPKIMAALLPNPEVMRLVADISVDVRLFVLEGGRGPIEFQFD